MALFSTKHEGDNWHWHISTRSTIAFHCQENNYGGKTRPHGLSPHKKKRTPSALRTGHVSSVDRRCLGKVKSRTRHKRKEEPTRHVLTWTAQNEDA
ncbi:hypothetical protein RUM44_002500 [Polyplax serrata]|uniref:Uncharacterized protein n=1 Tax=Polyplax serrata TaxID=468196 RepID=A0ABR1AF24_POLSC